MDEATTKDPCGELERAVQAARAGDPVEMIRSLYASRILDKLAFRIHSEYFGKLTKEDIDECLAEAVADAFQTLSRGDPINFLVAYLLKATRNMACDLAILKPEPMSDELADALAADQPRHTIAERQIRDHLRVAALAHARRLLPLIGQENIRRVMEVILDAIEQGVVDLTDARIAELTDLSEETVRRLKNRALQRLRHQAELAGFDLNQYQVLDEDDRPFINDNEEI